MINNINKPTSPFWSKFIVTCSIVSASIAAYGKWGAHSDDIELIGGFIGLAGVIIGVWAPSSKTEK
jgi:small-conductance mechanosensitive channel